MDDDRVNKAKAFFRSAYDMSIEMDTAPKDYPHRSYDDLGALTKELYTVAFRSNASRKDCYEMLVKIAATAGRNARIVAEEEKKNGKSREGE